MKILVDSQIYITEITKEMEMYIKKELSISNPELIKKKNMGFSTWNIPKTINMYSKKGATYIVPIGEIDNIWKIHPHREDYRVNFGKHEKIEFPKNDLKLYNYQEEAVKEMLKVKRGILESKCRIW